MKTDQMRAFEKGVADLKRVFESLEKLQKSWRTEVCALCGAPTVATPCIECAKKQEAK